MKTKLEEGSLCLDEERGFVLVLHTNGKFEWTQNGIWGRGEISVDEFLRRWDIRSYPVLHKLVTKNILHETLKGNKK